MKEMAEYSYKSKDTIFSTNIAAPYVALQCKNEMTELIKNCDLLIFNELEAH